jgi:GAF domain-containing protein
MSYLLLIPLVIYVALGMLTHEHHARSDAGRLLSSFLACLAVATAGELVLGTTFDLTAATIGAGLRLIGNAAASLILPFIPLALAHGRLPRVKGYTFWQRAIVAGIVLLSIAILALMVLPTASALAPGEGGGFHLERPTAHPAVMTSHLITIIGPLLAGVLVLFSMRRGHIVRPIEGWSVLGGMLVLLAIPLLDYDLGRWLRFFLLSGIFASFLANYRRTRPLHETLDALYTGQVGSLVALDEQGHAVWLNKEASRSFGVVLNGPKLNPAVVFANEPYARVLRWIKSISSSQATREFDTTNGDVRYTITAHVEPLPSLADLKGGRAVKLVKTTTSSLTVSRVTDGTARDPLSLLAQTLDSGPDMQSILGDTLDTVLKVTGLDSVLVYLQQKDNADLLQIVGTYSVQDTHLDPPQVFSAPGSFADPAMLQGQPVVLDGLNNHQVQISGYNILSESGMQAGMVAPLIARGHVLGVLIFLAEQPRTFPQNEILLLESVGRQLGAAYDSAYLHAAEYRHRVQTEVLNDIVIAMSRATSLDDALEAAIGQMRRIIDYDSTAIALFSDEHSTIRAWRGFPQPELVTQAMPLSEMPVYQNLREHKKLLRIDDTHQHPLWRTDILDELRIRSTINAPVLIRDECIGALSVDGEQVAQFNEEDAQVLQRLANHLAVALENVRLLDETRQHNKRLATLNKLSATISASLALDELLASALEVVVQLTGFESGDIYLHDEAGEQLLLSARHNLPDGVASLVETIDLGKELTSQVWQTGKPVVTYDYRSDPRRLSDDFDIQTFVCVPLVAKGEIIGALALMDRQQQSLGDEGLDLIVNIGQQLGVAIENTRLYEVALARARTAAQLSLLGILLTSSLNVAETLELICQHALDIFEVEGAYVWLVDGDHLVGAAATGQGREQFIARRLRLDDPTAFAARVVNEKQPLFVNDATQAEVHQELVKLTDCQALLGAPLFRDEEAIGSLMLVSTNNPNHFSEDDLGAVNLLSAHAALAIDNARLFEATSRQVRQLHLVQEVSRDVASYLDLDLLLMAVAERVWSAFRYYAVTIVVREGKELVPRALLRRGETLVGRSEAPQIIQTKGIIYSAANRGVPILVSDISQDSMHMPVDFLPETKAELAVPLVLAGEVLGVLDVQSDRVDGLTPADLDLLQPLAAQISISLSNAQLFLAVRDYTAALEMRVSERTQRIREQQERTDAILRSVGDGVAVVNLAGQIVLTNPVADALLSGQGRDAALGQRIRGFIHELVEQPESNHEQRLELDDIAIEAHTSKLVEDGRVQGTVIVLHDVTRLQEIDKLKSQFVSTVSHELRTPLANLKLYLQLLQSGKQEQHQQYIYTMEQETARLEHLIDNLLDLSRLDSPLASTTSRQPVDLNELVRLVIVNHEPQARAKHITLQANLDMTLPSVLGDRNQIIQVFTNLVGNALAYTPEGGNVWVRSGTQTTPQGDHAVIAVEDSGVGISPDEYNSIFDRFYRGKNANILGVSGSGLGLAIVKEIIEMHGGTISVSSAVGVGSTFTIQLPIYLPETE